MMCICTIFFFLHFEAGKVRRIERKLLVCRRILTSKLAFIGVSFQSASWNIYYKKSCVLPACPYSGTTQLSSPCVFAHAFDTAPSTPTLAAKSCGTGNIPDRRAGVRTISHAKCHATLNTIVRAALKLWEGMPRRRRVGIAWTGERGEGTSDLDGFAV